MSGGVLVIRSGELKPTPWPNGRGVTRDILRRTQADGRIDWLLSIADLNQDAPFSHFADVDRVFTVIEGGPVELTIEGAGPAACGFLVPFCFPGDRPSACRTFGASARAFNVFVDRATLAARVTAQSIAAGHVAPIVPGVAAIFCAAGQIEVGGTILEAGDTLEGAGATGLRARGGAAAVLLIDVAQRSAGSAVEMSTGSSGPRR